MVEGHFITHQQAARTPGPSGEVFFSVRGQITPTVCLSSLSHLLLVANTIRPWRSFGFDGRTPNWVMVTRHMGPLINSSFAAALIIIGPTFFVPNSPRDCAIGTRISYSLRELRDAKRQRKRSFGWFVLSSSQLQKLPSGLGGFIVATPWGAENPSACILQRKL